MNTVRIPVGTRWTVDALMGLPDDLKCEIHEGNLVIMAPARVWHQHVARLICNALVAAGRFAVTEVGIMHRRDDMRIPDVAVFRKVPDPNDSLHGPEDIELVVEVWSPSSGRKDNYRKQWYADGGIPEYWLAIPVEDDEWGAQITQYRLADGHYIEVGVTTVAELTGQSAAS